MEGIMDLLEQIRNMNEMMAELKAKEPILSPDQKARARMLMAQSLETFEAFIMNLD